jgi:hypothetical protein
MDDHGGAGGAGGAGDKCDEGGANEREGTGSAEKEMRCGE